ncbi:WW domain containing protein, putative [Leishmania donovani]|uniref:WW domain containing protein, putative n=1 Tax=Leishmania donovani TaxID=5661 RepID=A0A3S7X3B4_LEIDO|nr:WW domain containing protein, putative [Leishmania donovani]
MSSSMLRSGLQLVAIDYSNPQPQYPGGPVLDAAAFSYDPLSEESAALHQCVSAVNSPPVTYGVDDLLGRITNVEFIAAGGSPEEAAAGAPMHYRLASSLEPMLNATLNPAITAVVDHCLSSIVLVYGATQEMKQMGLIGTPEECGLLPHGIRTLMERLLDRKEHQLSKAASLNCTAKPTGDRAAAASDSVGSDASPSAPPRAAGSVSPPFGGGDDAVSDSDHTEAVHSRSATSHTHSFVFPSIGSRHHRFVRMEATFIAFDSTSVVDLLDLSNKHAELVLKLAPPPTPSAFEEMTCDVSAAASTSPTTDSFVLNAQAMPVENANDALSALDIGLDNLTRALELPLLQSESGSSLLFSLTAFTDTCRCATMHMLCLAEDPAAQAWLVSTVQARSQAIPLGEEQSWASIQNTPMPPPLHHHAATMLVPALCFGNMFTSVLICVYNSITALSRLNRDLTLAVTGYRMRTIPRVTLASSRRGLKKLPPSWEEHFTNDGRRYFIDTSTQTTTWKDPRFTYPHCSSRSGGLTGNNPSGSGTGADSGRSSRSGSPHHRPSRISLGPGDKDFLMSRLQQEMHGGSPSATDSTGTTQQPAACAGRLPALGAPASGADSLDIGIIVVDTMCRPRVLIHSRNPQFALQYDEQEEVLRAKRRELEEARVELQRKAKAAAVLGEAAGEAQDAGPASVPDTAKPREAVQPIVDRAAPTQAVDLAHSSPTPAKGVVGLDDVDDEEISALCHRNSVKIEDFMFEDDSDEGGEDDEASGTEQISTPESAFKAGGVAISQSCTASSAEARFYANVLQEQAAGVGEVSASSTVSSTETSVAVSPVIKSAAAPGSSSNIAAAASDEQSSSVISDAPHGGTTMAAAPPEVQDLESLVDEFTAFYRRAFELQQRVAELEAELKRPKSTARSSSPLSLPVAAEASDAGVHELVHQMLKAVELSPSAEVRAALTPMLTNAASTAPATATASVVLQAFHEALRIAAQTNRAGGRANAAPKQ